MKSLELYLPRQLSEEYYDCKSHLEELESIPEIEQIDLSKLNGKTMAGEYYKGDPKNLSSYVSRTISIKEEKENDSTCLICGGDGEENSCKIY